MVLEHAWENEQYGCAMHIAEAMLKHNLKNIAAILGHASAYGRMLDMNFRDPLPDAVTLTPAGRRVHAAWTA